MDQHPSIEVERLGGLAGFGPGSRRRSRGALAWAELSAAERDTLQRLLDGRDQPAPARGADMFRYRISAQLGGRMVSVEVPEHAVPDAVRNCVRDEFS